MKKLLSIILALVLCIGLSAVAFAEDMPDNSTPRLMVTSYKIENGFITPSETRTLEITFKNYSKAKSLHNIKLTLADASGEIETEGMPTAYVSTIKAGGTYVWKATLKAAKTAQIGEHALTVTSEYEDKNYSPYTGSDTIKINVRQSVNLDFSGLTLPKKSFQDETVTVTVTLMNTGKTDLRNCRLDFSVDGLATGGTTFVGEIPAGESREATANLRVDSEKLGEVKGTAAVSYDDAFGDSYSKTADLSTVIEKKKETPKTPEKEEKKNPLWWLFLIIGFAVGGGAGFGIPTAIHSRKQRKEDDLRLENFNYHFLYK